MLHSNVTRKFPLVPNSLIACVKHYFTRGMKSLGMPQPTTREQIYASRNSQEQTTPINSIIGQDGTVAQTNTQNKLLKIASTPRQLL